MDKRTEQQAVKVDSQTKGKCLCGFTEFCERCDPLKYSPAPKALADYGAVFTVDLDEVGDGQKD